MSELPELYIIDDDLITLKLLEAGLEAKGYTVSKFLGGVPALRNFDIRPVKLVITDIFLPDLDGHSLTREIKERGSDIKVIAMSSTPDTKNFKVLELATQLGADLVFTKPIDLEELDRAIKKLFDLS